MLNSRGKAWERLRQNLLQTRSPAIFPLIEIENFEEGSDGIKFHIISSGFSELHLIIRERMETRENVILPMVAKSEKQRKKRKVGPRQLKKQELDTDWVLPTTFKYHWVHKSIEIKKYGLSF